jgi:REP element-mobilizing transposase RayT
MARMGRTLAIHWAATTYGTWLHGDPRGSWRNGRLIGPDLYLEAAARASMSADAVVLDDIERQLVAESFGSVVREQGHRIHAATVQPTHVHLVLAPLKENLTTVVARLKRRSAAAVLAQRRRWADTDHSPARMAGLYSRPILGREYAPRVVGRNPPQLAIPRSLWTAGKFPVFIFDELHVCNAIEYVRDHNRRLGLPPDPFEWLEPLYPPGDRMGERFFPSEANVHPPL